MMELQAIQLFLFFLPVKNLITAVHPSYCAGKTGMAGCSRALAGEWANISLGGGESEKV
jgi:hypothetical protein